MTKASKDEGYDSYIQVKVFQKTKEEFQRVCKERAINPSALVRKMIEEFIEDAKRKDGVEK